MTTRPALRLRRLSAPRGYTLLELLLVLLICGILVAAIAAAIANHLRVSEAGRTEVEQAQLARALLRRIGDDLRGAVPYVEPVESEAGTTGSEVDAAIASAAAGTGGTTGGGTTSSTGGTSTGGRTSTGSSGGSTSSSSGGSGAQTLQPLGTLSTLKPQSANSSAGSSSGATSGSSSNGSSASGGSSTASESETTEETTIAKPGIYGDQYTLQVDVSRVPRAGLVMTSTAGLDAPGDVKTIGYFVATVPRATDAAGQAVMGLYRQSFDKAVAAFDASAGTSAVAHLLAEEVSAIEFRYFDGTTWQTSWDSSSGTLPTAVEIAITVLTHPSATLTVPQIHRLTVAIPAAQGASTSTSTDASAESSSASTSSSSSGSTP